MDEIIARLKELHRERRLIPFVGAGFSSRLGVPGAVELRNQLAEELGFDPDVFASHGDLRSLAQYAMNVKTIGPIRQAFSERLHTPQAEEARANSKAHKLLAIGEFVRIYTTNYDAHIERAFEDHGKACEAIASLYDLQRPKQLGATQVVHFHGSLAYEDSMVLDESSYYQRLRFEHPFDLLLRADSLQNAFLFLGYGFQDPNVRYIWNDLAERMRELSEPQKGAKLRSVIAGVGFGEVQRTILENWDIDVLQLDPVDPGAHMDRVLEAIVT